MIKVSDLTGTKLDYWVARAEGVEAKDILFPLSRQGERVCAIMPRYEPGPATVYRPSTHWAAGGPLIEKYEIMLDRYHGEDCWCAYLEDRMGCYGDTPLQAICRSVVRAKFGDEVEDVAT